jgi:hypothetical protein
MSCCHRERERESEKELQLPQCGCEDDRRAFLTAFPRFYRTATFLLHVVVSTAYAAGDAAAVARTRAALQAVVRSCAVSEACLASTVSALLDGSVRGHLDKDFVKALKSIAL